MLLTPERVYRKKLITTNLMSSSMGSIFSPQIRPEVAKNICVGEISSFIRLQVREDLCPEFNVARRKVKGSLLGRWWALVFIELFRSRLGYGFGLCI